MSVIPAPPLDPDTGALRLLSAQIVAALRFGRVGYCVMCQHIGTWWWDLTLDDLEPVTDRAGVLTDQVPLHAVCAPAVIAYWSTMIWGAGDDEPPLTGGSAEDPEPGGDSVTRAASPRSGNRAALLGGLYANGAP